MPAPARRPGNCEGCSTVFSALPATEATLETWKRFGERDLSHSMTHYLQVVAGLMAEKHYARAADVARRLQVSRSGVSSMLRTLAARGYVRHERYGHVELTELGAELARRTEANRRVLITFLSEILGVPQPLAEEDACMIEHLVSPEVVHALLDLTTFVASQHPAAQAFREAFAGRGTAPAVALTLCDRGCVRTQLEPRVPATAAQEA